MYQDYLDDIVKYYWMRAGDASFPQRLIRPTPAKIKKECLAVCHARFQHRDIRILMAFFSAESNEAAIFKAIGRCDRDRFKPLSNFLREVTDKTDDLNIDLLAWLIDFPNRPYKPEDYTEGLSITENISQNNSPLNTSQVKNEIVESVTGDSKNAEADKTTKDELVKLNVGNVQRLTFPNTVQKVAIAMICLLFLSLAVSYFAMDRETPSGIFLNGQQKCMIWAGDHYIQSSCELKRGDTLVVALDLKRLMNFKRITRPDTITLSSEGKLWYIKRSGHIEYYTAGGRHPIEPDRVLRPLTRHMILAYQKSREF